jgi:hypothetical protein
VCYAGARDRPGDRDRRDDLRADSGSAGRARRRQRRFLRDRDERLRGVLAPPPARQLHGHGLGDGLRAVRRRSRRDLERRNHAAELRAREWRRGEPHSDADADTDADPNPDSDSDSDAHGDGGRSLTYADAHAHSDSDGHADSNSDVDVARRLTDADADADADSDAARRRRNFFQHAPALSGGGHP